MHLQPAQTAAGGLRELTALLRSPSWIWGKKSKGEGERKCKEREEKKKGEQKHPENKFLVTVYAKLQTFKILLTQLLTPT